MAGEDGSRPRRFERQEQYATEHFAQPLYAALFFRLTFSSLFGGEFVPFGGVQRARSRGGAHRDDRELTISSAAALGETCIVVGILRNILQHFGTPFQEGCYAWGQV